MDGGLMDKVAMQNLKAKTPAAGMNFEKLTEPYFEMHINHEGHLYIVTIAQREGEPGSVIEAVNVLVKAAHALGVAVGAIQEEGEDGKTAQTSSSAGQAMGSIPPRLPD